MDECWCCGSYGCDFSWCDCCHGRVCGEHLGPVNSYRLQTMPYGGSSMLVPMIVENVCSKCREYIKGQSKWPTEFYEIANKLSRSQTEETNKKAERQRISRLTPEQLAAERTEAAKATRRGFALAASSVDKLERFYRDNCGFFSFAANRIFARGRSRSAVLSDLYSRAAKNPGGASYLTCKHFAKSITTSITGDD